MKSEIQASGKHYWWTSTFTEQVTSASEKE